MIRWFCLRLWNNWLSSIRLASLNRSRLQAPRPARRRPQTWGQAETLETRALPTPAFTSSILKTIGDLDDFTASVEIIPTQNAMYFIASSFEWELEQLWVTDGTSAGTKLLHEFTTVFGPTWSAGDNWVEYNGELYFSAHRAGEGNGLWKTDGTPEGTVLVTDAPASPNSFAILGDKFYFAGRDTAHGRELWVSDGTAQGTHMLLDLMPGSKDGLNNWGDTPIVPLHGKLYFSGQSTNQNYELWSTDGTVQGTQRVKDLYPGSHQIPFDGSFVSSSYPRNLQELNGQLLFTARTPTGPNNELTYDLWISDGTSQGTTIIRDLDEVEGTTATYITSPQIHLQSNGLLYFSPRTDDPLSFQELWVTDGTIEGTRFLKGIYPGSNRDSEGGYLSSGISGMWESQGLVYFSADDGVHGEREPWITDGTTAGTRLLKDIAVGSNRYFDILPSSPSQFTPFAGYTIFEADDWKNGPELWVTDGTASGTARITDIKKGKLGSYPVVGTVLNGDLLFFAEDATYTLRLYRLSLASDQPTGPEINPQTFTIAENSPAGTVVGTASATSAAKKPKLNYAITAGNTLGLFEIDSVTGQIRVVNAAGLDFETNPQFQVTVTVTAGSASASAVMTIQLTDQVENLSLQVAGTTLTVPAGKTATLIDSQAVIVVNGQGPSSWNGVQLVVNVAMNRQSKDVLSVQSRTTGETVITAKGKKLLRNGVQIGTISGGKGKQGTLTVTFNSSADIVDVETTLQQIGFATTGTGGERQVALQLVGIQGTSSPAASRTLNVT